MSDSMDLDYFSEMVETVQSDLNTDAVGNLYPVITIKKALNRSYRKCGGLFSWPELEDAKLTSTDSGYEYYDYPPNWYPDSIWKLKVDGVDYGDPLSFGDYMYEKENNLPSGLSKLWSSQWRRYFIYPVPTTDGDNNIEVHGQKIVTKMVNDGDYTIFSFSMPECNEAVVLEAEAILRAKGDDNNDKAFKSAEAKQILVVSFGKIKKNQAKYERTKPMFNVTDMFGTKSSKDKIGDFE